MWYILIREGRVAVDPATVERRVKKVTMAETAEQAQDLEYALWQDVLTAIAEGRCHSPGNCASIALRTTKLDFPRWPV